MQSDSKNLILGVLAAACLGSIGSIAVELLIYGQTFEVVNCGGMGVVFGGLGGLGGKAVAYLLSKSIGIKTWAVCGFIGGMVGGYMILAVLQWFVKGISIPG